MMTENDFSKYYKKISNTELLEILENPKNYQPLAIKVAKQEFSNRQLSDDEINLARLPLIEKQLLKERKRQKRESIENNVKDKTAILIETLNPIQKETPSIDKTILLIELSFGFIFIFNIITSHRILLRSIKDFSRFPFISLETLFPVIILPIALLTFWNKKKIGWILLTIYLTFSATESVLSLLANQYDLISSIFQSLLFIGTLFLISKQNIMEQFSINRKNQETTIIITVIMTLVFLVAGIMS